MSTTFIGTTFPQNWLYGKYEIECVENLRKQIDQKFKNQHNLFINLTWFGPQFDNGQWEQYLQYRQQFDNLFLLCTVDPAMINAEQIQTMVAELGNPTLFKIGNFDSEYQFNFFAPLVAKYFQQYTPDEISLREIKHIYINYNRKPRSHRVQFVKKLLDTGLAEQGIITLGKPNYTYDNDSSNNLYLTLGENPADYVKHGHWFGKGPDEFGIPHDLMSLHRIDLWQQHFLYIIGATEFNWWDDVFVQQDQFKPMIGLRPFLINGNVRTYQWLRDRGFKTFNHYWPHIDLEILDEHQVHDSIIDVVKYLGNMTKAQLKELYQTMLPDLLHNQKRFFEFAQEQKYRIENLFQ